MPKPNVVIVGVRHHSPACARLVERVVRDVKPRYVLIEGPSEINDRIGELALSHELPIALYSYVSAGDHSRGSYSPFCAYSPEWVALRSARSVGADALFVDLPSYHRAFSGIENRYSDRHLLASSRLDELCEQLGFESTDALWDHLFEGETDLARLSAKLGEYFVALRGDEPGGPRDEPRERFMAQWVAWAAEAAGESSVVVVCGGYHAPELERTWRDASTERPTLPPPPDDARTGTYLVPYSFHRLDAFTGYQSGMPSPAYYQAVWTEGARAGAERMVRASVERLRSKRQRISAADLIGASALTEGLMRLRGHTEPRRIDVLDGLASALVKEALSAPLPWARRGTIERNTDPLIVEILAAFSGDRHGTLAEGTPRPPLVSDAFVELASVGITPIRTPQSIVSDLLDAEGRRRSRVLHRLRILEVPEFVLTRVPSQRRGATDLTEKWRVAKRIETDAALVESAAWGATLEDAALARLSARAREASTASHLAEVLFDAILAGLRSLGKKLLEDVRAGLLREPDLAEMGDVTQRLLELRHRSADPETIPRAELDVVLRAAFDRGTWLFEGLSGGDVPAHAANVDAIVALRDVVQLAGSEIGIDSAVTADLARRRALDPNAPSYVRGAGLGLLAALEPSAAHATDAARSVKSAGKPTAIGDFLMGLFALAREEVRTDAALLAAIDATLATMTERDFLIALPALRQAFAYFPPREKADVARLMLARHRSPASEASLLNLDVSHEVVVRGAELDAAVFERARRYGLLGGRES